MKALKRSILISIILLFGSISIINCQINSKDIGKFREAPCPFTLPEGLVLGENFKFGYINVPEFHAKPNGKTLELAVAIFPSTESIHEPDPIVMNTAGPGKSNMDQFVFLIAGGLGNYILPHRDIVIIECANAIKSELRDIDSVARLGGEEFSIVCPYIKQDAMMKLMEKMRQAIELMDCRESGAEPQEAEYFARLG